MRGSSSPDCAEGACGPERGEKQGRNRPHYLLGPIVTTRSALRGRGAQGGCENAGGWVASLASQLWATAIE